MKSKKSIVNMIMCYVEIYYLCLAALYYAHNSINLHFCSNDFECLILLNENKSYVCPPRNCYAHMCFPTAIPCQIL